MTNESQFNMINRCLENLMCLSMSSKDHAMVSKAFAISTLSRMHE
jgi:hypothetical protein